MKRRSPGESNRTRYKSKSVNRTQNASKGEAERVRQTTERREQGKAKWKQMTLETQATQSPTGAVTATCLPVPW
jgi:hypothetical protein